MEFERYPFGVLPDGQTAELCVLSDTFAQVTISTLGATIVGVRVPNWNGVWADIALGFDTAMDYLTQPGCLGATIGRYAGRIAHGRFPLNGKTVELDKNQPSHTIHGGPEGFHRRLWAIRAQTRDRLELALHSPDCDQGFPGSLSVSVIFTLRDSALTMEIHAISDADTVCNITNHVYWNLAGHDSGTIDGQMLTVNADCYLETDENTIPTGCILPVDGTVLDLRVPVSLQGLTMDHTLLLPEREGVQTAGRLWDPASGRWLEISTDLPSVQVYTSNYLPHNMSGKSGAVYGPRSGVCLEAQFCPDSPNHINFASALLHAGEAMDRTIRWTFGTADRDERKVEKL